MIKPEFLCVLDLRKILPIWSQISLHWLLRRIVELRAKTWEKKQYKDFRSQKSKIEKFSFLNNGICNFVYGFVEIFFGYKNPWQIVGFFNNFVIDYSGIPKISEQEPFFQQFRIIFSNNQNPIHDCQKIHDRISMSKIIENTTSKTVFTVIN